MDWQERGRALFYLPGGDSQLQSGGEHCSCTQHGSSVASPGAMGKAVSGFTPTVCPGLVFHPEEGSCILYLFTYQVSTQELIWSRASRAKLSKQQCLSTSRPCPRSPLMLTLMHTQRKPHGAFQRHIAVKPGPVFAQTLFMFTVFSCLDHSLCLLQWKDLDQAYFVPLISTSLCSPISFEGKHVSNILVLTMFSYFDT